MATIKLTPDFKEFLRLLNSEQNEYLLIGGYMISQNLFTRSKPFAPG